MTSTKNRFSEYRSSKVNSNNTFFRSSHTGVYSSAALGLMYINDARTFSISGSISIEKDDYPMYYYNPVKTTKANNKVADYR